MDLFSNFQPHDLFPLPLLQYSFLFFLKIYAFSRSWNLPFTMGRSVTIKDFFFHLLPWLNCMSVTLPQSSLNQLLTCVLKPKTPLSLNSELHGHRPHRGFNWLQSDIATNLNRQRLTFGGVWYVEEMFSSWMNPGFYYSGQMADSVWGVILVTGLLITVVAHQVAHGCREVMVWVGVC